MMVLYEEALEILKSVTHDHSANFDRTEESIPLGEAGGRIIARKYVSPKSTPPFDTSAMDGYAIHSGAVTNASVDNAVTFAVKGTIAAGDDILSLPCVPEHGILPCVEIMTGARFPESTSGDKFDACVRVEDTVALSGKSEAESYIRVMKPVSHNANRRFAGSDFQEGEEFVAARSVIRPHHIMALASLGVGDVTVLRKLRIGILSTGKELFPKSGAHCRAQVSDANGPYLTAVLRDFGAEVTFLGVVEDSADVLQHTLRRHIDGMAYDLIITTGAVSAGKFDFVRPAIEILGATVHFHGVAMRPGHPVLFASLPQQRHLENGCDKQDKPIVTSPQSPAPRGTTSFFGLPGNPIAAAACLRFLVLPYIRYLQSQPPETPISVRAKVPHVLEIAEQKVSFPTHLDLFRHGVIGKEVGELVVELSKDQSPGKVKPFAGANCWVHIPRGHGAVMDREALECFPLSGDWPL